jgi:hypothetical protein
MIRLHVTPRVLRRDMIGLECCAPYKMTSQVYLNRRASIEVMMALFNTALSPHVSRLWPINTPSYAYSPLLASLLRKSPSILDFPAFGPPNSSLLPVLSPVSFSSQVFLFLALLCLSFFSGVLGCPDNG